MTYQEAMDNIRCALDGGCPHKYNCSAHRSEKCLDKEIEESINMIKELVGKAEKYKWHDLRKNPNDLPDTTRPVMIAYVDFESDAVTFYDVAFNGINNAWYSSETDNFEYHDEGFHVIAWREIEPFEEVET